MNYKIGIDVGGTFTDFLLTRSDGQFRTYKVLSTPKDPSVATMQGISEMAHDEGMALKDFLALVDVIVHGTTVTTNAVLTYRGARTGLLTTEGVRDALEMRRGIREEQYNNRYSNVVPLVPRHLRLSVAGRLDYAGKEIAPLAEEQLRSQTQFLKDSETEAVAICFMNSFANRDHEQQAARMVRQIMPDAYVSVSTEVLPSIRFYDRVSTTVLNAYVGPILRRYLQSLLKKLDDAGFPNILLIMQSNGGVISPEFAMDHAATTLLSGPAGGPVAGIVYAGIQNYRDCITMDMGGTSFDCALIKDATPFTTTVGEINRLRLALPMLNVVTIGAGGGSIGWIDEGGLLRMGPQSASSDPGPASYGLGGEDPTCTDADLVLGYLDPEFFAGGRMPLYADRAKSAIEAKIAKPLGYDLYEAAAGMYQVINVNMAAAVREVAVKHGQDPRDFPLVVAGGAGPNHACMIALELENPVLIVPRESSIFCAAGMLMSDLKHDFVRTYAVNLQDADPQVFGRLFEEMRKEGKQLLISEGIKESSIEYRYSLDLRYVKQYHEVGVTVTAQEVDRFDIGSMARRFHPAHNALYGYSLEDQGTPIELINMRLACIGSTDKPEFQQQGYAGDDPSRAYKRSRRVYLPLQKEFREVSVFDGLALECGNHIQGPAIIEQVNTTTFVAPEFNVLTDRFGSFTMYLKDCEEEVKKEDLLMSNEIDKVLVSILQRRLKSITEEMSIALTMTTRSPILCEAKDFVTGLYDARGKMLEQTENLPILSFSLGPVCEYIVDYFGHEIYPGDVIFHNDVFSMGNQNNDVAAYKPIFSEGILVGWAACKGHQADIGGAVQGGYNPNAVEVWQEALRIPPVKVYERGKLRKDVWNLIFANIRLDIVAEDMRAEIGSCVVGERGLLKIIERYGRDVFEAHKEYLFDSTEKMMRSEIRTIPKGVYYGESTCYFDGKNPGSKYQIRVKISVDDEEITFDYSDTDAQTTGFVNGTYTSSASATILTFLQMVNPDMPHNDGMVRPVKIIIPEGTILNAAYPAATTYGNHLCPNNADAIMRALGPVIPDRVTAEWNELLCSLTTGMDPRKNTPYVDIGFMGLKGGSGAIEGVDGYDHIGMIDASGGVLDQDYEMFEQQTPHLLVKHEYWQDSAGPGQWRGGLGVETEFVIGSDRTKLVTFGDGDVEPARGAMGGMGGTLNKIELTYPGGRKYLCTTKDLVEDVPKGTVYFQQAGGGGGYGPPFLRSKEKVAEEVRNGIISLEAARENYGVVVHPETFAVDEAETQKLRASRAGSPT